MGFKFMVYLRGLKYYLFNYVICWIPSYFLRYLISRYVYSIRLHPDSCIHIGVKIFGHGKGLSVGKSTVINPECRLDGRGGLDIGENVSISRETFILTLTHDYNNSDFNLVAKPVLIDDDAWLGIRSMVMPGVKIGKGAVVAAGSVVTKDVAPYDVVAGVPAKPVSERTKQQIKSVYYRPFMGGET